MFGALVGGALGLAGSLFGAKKQSKAIQGAADQSAAMQQAAIEEHRRQFDAIQKLLAPYVHGGQVAFDTQMGLMGLKGADVQAQQMAQLQSSPEYQALVRESENALLQNASATGGLRGGNMQNALASNRQNALNSLVQQKLGQLGGVANAGLGAAQNTGVFGQNMAGTIGGLQSGIGQTMGNAALAQGGIQSNLIGNVAGGLGQLAGSYFNQPSSGGGFQMIGGNPF